MGKVPSYTQKAIKKYREKQYFMQVRFPLELKERLQAAGLTASVVSDLVLSELERREKIGVRSDTKNTQPEKETSRKH